TAAGPAEAVSAEPVAQLRIGDRRERDRARVAGLVGVKVEVETPRRRKAEHAIELPVQSRRLRHDGAENSAVARDDVGERIAEFALQMFDREDGDRLQRDAAAPALAQSREQRPAHSMLRRDRIEMRADRERAVRIGGAETELEARLD